MFYKLFGTKLRGAVENYRGRLFINTV